MDQSQAVLKRNHVTVLGTGERTMLFAHGFGCDQHMWRFVAPDFMDDYQVVLFDYVGHGASDSQAYDKERYGTLHGYAQDILEVCEALSLREVIFVGHSVSGIIGMLAAIQKPAQFAQLIMLSPSPCFINHPPDYVGGFEEAQIAELLETMEQNYLGWANFLAPTIMQNRERPDLSKELEHSFCSVDRTIARQFARVTFLSDHRADLPKLTVPTFIVQCSNDAIAPRSVGEYMHQHLPRSTLSILSASGHCPHMSHPTETIQLIRDYLRRQARA